MKYDKVTIKQVPDDSAVASGLSKYGRSKMPSTSEYLQVAKNVDGRYITGIDEEALSIKNIKDEQERKRVEKETLELRLELEKKLQKDLKATSTFWESTEDELGFGIGINSDSDLTLHRNNPMDVIKYHALIANHYAAPSKEDAAKPEFLSAKYYCHVEETVHQLEMSTQKLRDKARAQLLDVTEDTDYAILLGQYLEGDKYKKGMRPSTIYKMLSDYIDRVNEPENVKKFTKAVSMPVEDLTYKVTVDRAIRKKIIKYNNKYFQRGQVTLGRDASEVYENLRKPDFATEFLSIKEELEETV